MMRTSIVFSAVTTTLVAADQCDAGQCAAGQCGAGQCGAGQCGAGQCGAGQCCPSHAHGLAEEAYTPPPSKYATLDEELDAMDDEDVDPLDAVKPELAAELDAVFEKLASIMQAPPGAMDWKEIIRESGMDADTLLKEAKEVLADPSMLTGGPGLEDEVAMPAPEEDAAPAASVDDSEKVEDVAVDTEDGQEL